MSQFLDELDEFIATLPQDILRISVGTPDEIIETSEHLPGNPCQDTYSVSKFFTVTAIGVLFDRGLIKPEDKIVDILKDYLPKNGMDDRWNQVTVEMCMTHHTGLPEGFLDIDVNRSSAFTNDFLTYMLTYPLKYNPGERHAYTDGSFYLLGRCVAEITGIEMDTFLLKNLLNDMDYQELAWSRCPWGHPMGGTGLYIRSDDMCKLGLLYLNNGCYGGKRLLSEEWCQMALNRGYGLDIVVPDKIYAKGGMLGQMLMIIPALGKSVAVQSYGGNVDQILAKIQEYIH